MNILIAGLGQPEEPVELKPLRRLTAEQALAMKQEAHRSGLGSSLVP